VNTPNNILLLSAESDFIDNISSKRQYPIYRQNLSVLAYSMWLLSLGSNLNKTSEFEISLLELSQLPENMRNARIEHFHNQLKAALPPPPAPPTQQQQLPDSVDTDKDGIPDSKDNCD
jgi:hypothetical protein